MTIPASLSAPSTRWARGSAGAPRSAPPPPPPPGRRSPRCPPPRTRARRTACAPRRRAPRGWPRCARPGWARPQCDPRTHRHTSCMYLSPMSETTLQLPQGPVRVREEGQGPPIVFIHGLLADGRLWDDVVTPLAETARCIVPDLPLGAHRQALKPDADLSPYGLAQVIADLLAAL